MSLLVAFPFCAKDTDRLLDLLQWCSQLGHSTHEALLVADPSVPWTEGVKAIRLAESAFARVHSVALPAHVEGWIPGSLALFKAAATEAKERNLPWVFMEPDAVPLKADWLDQLEGAYQRCGQKFMGALVSHQTPGLPSPYLEGVAVYPPEAIDIMAPSWREDQTWTFACAGVVVPQAVNTPLIQHLWGTREAAPTFAEVNVPGTNIHCLRQIHPEAVIWHRCKNGSLIRLLRKRANITTAGTPLIVVFPFCNKDGGMFVRTAQWMRELNERYPYHAILSYDLNTSPGPVRMMREIVQGCFASVGVTAYSPPRRGEWPPTTAWLHAARHLAKMGSPWLWLEYDMIPLKPDWIGLLDAEYRDGGKPFMGPVVPGLGHMNGTGIYPPDTPERVPSAMRDLTHAWDMAMKAEMIEDCHDCGHLLQHVWVMDGSGKFQPTGAGRSPTFRDRSALSQILPTACAFHRCKDGTLIDRLRESKNDPNHLHSFIPKAF